MTKGWKWIDRGVLNLNHLGVANEQSRLQQIGTQTNIASNLIECTSRTSLRNTCLAQWVLPWPWHVVCFVVVCCCLLLFIVCCCY